MSRSATGDTVVIKPANTVYTALAVAATVIVITGFIVMYMRAESIFGKTQGLFN